MEKIVHLQQVTILLGSNHILPTNGFGKTRGSLSVLDFVKINKDRNNQKRFTENIKIYEEHNFGRRIAKSL